mmetsp:Transcript_58694/g.162306  ORF Transcript_58694/g.162306 Transcript_58694/m.162306 type:complete len:201 (-) Transcript_58694:352-954(-)
MGRRRNGWRLQGRRTSNAQSPRLAVTRFEPRKTANSNVVAPYTCVASYASSMRPVSQVPSSTSGGWPVPACSFARQLSRRSLGSSSGGMPKWCTPETPSQMPRCVRPSSTASALVMPVLVFAGCCFEKDAEMKVSSNAFGPNPAAAGGATLGPVEARPPRGSAQERHVLRPVPAPWPTFGTQERLGNKLGPATGGAYARS